MKRSTKMLIAGAVGGAMLERSGALHTLGRATHHISAKVLLGAIDYATEVAREEGLL